MYDLFIWIFNMSITAGWLILAVLGVRFLSRRMPKNWHCFLWYLVMLRLFIPLSIESQWSLIPKSKVITEDLLYSQNSVVEVENINITEQMLTSDGPMSDEEKQAKFETYLERVQAEDFITPNPGAGVNPLQVIVYGASYIWLLGAVAMLVYTVVRYARVSKRIREAILLKENIYQSEYVDSPFVFGIIKPRIYVPFSLQGEALDCVVAHECIHIKRFDHIVRFLAFLLLSVYWFHPLVWVFYLLLCHDMELACDEMVLQQIGLDKRKLYSQTLLECSVSPKKTTVCPLAFGEISVKQRIRNILHFRKPAVWLVVGTGLLCVVLVICFMTNPVNERYGTGSAKTEYEEGKGDEEISHILPMDNINADVREMVQEQLKQQIENLPEVKNLTEPPALYLTDPLSSLLSEFPVQADTYEWSYQTADGVTQISACGLHPLERDESAKYLKIPNYNGMEDVIYTFAYSVIPDRVEIKEYSIRDMGNVEAEPLEEKALGGDLFVPLKHNRIYEIKAAWDESKFEERGFYGNAYYTVISGKKTPVEESSITIIAHAKEIIDEEKGRILISSDSDAYPGAFLLDILENVYDIKNVKCGEQMMICMQDTGVKEGKLPVYKAHFIQKPFAEDVNTLDGVTMYMDTYKSVEGEVKIRNEYGKKLQYGDWYDIQIQQDGKWYSLPLIVDNAAYNDIAYLVQDQSMSVWKINWSYFYGELSAGKYRIVKDINDLRAPGDYTKYYLATEFEVK